MPQLRVLSWNLWHALNPYGRLRMQRLETEEQGAVRVQKQEETLRNGFGGPGDILCLQELNPVRRRARALSEKLRMKSESALVNTGIKVGTMGIPNELSEGLGVFVGSGFSDLHFEELILSGGGVEIRLPLGLDLSLQAAERRKALIFSGVLERKRVLVANLHLHHGPDSVSENRSRKLSELNRLSERLAVLMPEVDIAIVCGDFNSDEDSPIMEPLLKLGFKDAAREAGVSAPATWDPRINRYSRLSSEVATDEDARVWDAAPHVFDRIYIAQATPHQVRYWQIREPVVSDHFAVCAEITW